MDSLKATALTIINSSAVISTLMFAAGWTTALSFVLFFNTFSFKPTPQPIKPATVTSIPSPTATSTPQPTVSATYQNFVAPTVYTATASPSLHD